MATERERESVHLLRSILVTAPVFHFDTSELNADAPSNTAERVQQRKEKTNPPQTTKKSTGSNTQTTKITTRVRIVIR